MVIVRSVKVRDLTKVLSRGLYGGVVQALLPAILVAWDSEDEVTVFCETGEPWMEMRCSAWDGELTWGKWESEDGMWKLEPHDRCWIRVEPCRAEGKGGVM